MDWYGKIMAEDLITNVIIILISVFLGFVLSEVHDWRIYSRETKERQQKIVKILFINSKGINNTFNSYTHDCHRPEYDEYLEMVCIARKVQGKLISQILTDIQNISQEMIFINNSIATTVFDLKWALNDFIRTTEEVLEFDKFWEEETRKIPIGGSEESEERWYFQVGLLLERFREDFNFAKDVNLKLTKELIEKYGLKDLMTQEEGAK